MTKMLKLVVLGMISAALFHLAVFVLLATNGTHYQDLGQNISIATVLGAVVFCCLAVRQVFVVLDRFRSQRA